MCVAAARMAMQPNIFAPIRQHQEDQQRRLRGLIEAGRCSGAGRRPTSKVAAELKKRALDGLR
jgi:hypothetical protein